MSRSSWSPCGHISISDGQVDALVPVLGPDPPEGGVVVVKLGVGRDLGEDLQLLPPGPLLLLRGELVQGQLGHQLPRLDTGEERINVVQSP